MHEAFTLLYIILVLAKLNTYGYGLFLGACIVGYPFVPQHFSLKKKY